MPLTGTNKLCQQCVKSCKQWAQIKIIKCLNYQNSQKSTFSRMPNLKEGIPFPHSKTPKQPFPCGIQEEQAPDMVLVA